MTTLLQTHPSPGQLRAFAQGRLSGMEMAEVEQHVAACDSCCRHLEGVPDDTLVQLAREAATRGIRSPDAPTPPPARPAPGEIPPELRDHPRYRVLSLLGNGGMGAVYKAEHRMMERLVALKVISHSLLANPQAVERFHREFRAAARLSHHNIVAAHDADQAGSLHFFVMEFVDGVSLDRVVAHNGPLAPLHAAYLIYQAAQGLQHAHEKGMVHRDIKPQNLMMTRQKKVKILDFGLIRLGAEQALGPAHDADDAAGTTKAGMILGTPDYISPEQARDARSADIRADIYSLGCTLYYLLTGQPPFPTGSVLDKLQSHLNSAPPSILERRRDVPPELARILNKMLAKNPAERYQTPGEVAKDLAPLAKGQGGTIVSAPPASPPASGRRQPPGNADVPTRDMPPPAPPADFAPVESDALAPLAGSEFAALSTSPLDALAFDTSLRPLSPVVTPPRGSVLPFGLTPQVAAIAGVGLAAALILLVWGVASALLGGSDNQEQSAQQQASVSSGTSAFPDNRAPPTKSANVSPPVDPAATSPAVSPASQSAGEAATAASPSNRQVLLVVPNQGLWYPDYSQVKREFENLGMGVVTISTSLNRCQLTEGSPPGECIPDKVLDASIRAADYDAIVFAGANTSAFNPGGPSSTETRRLLSEFKQRGKILASICAGQRVLVLHGALHGKQAARCQYVDASFGPTSAIQWDWDATVKRDGTLITARRDSDAAELALAVRAAIDEQ